MNFDLKIYQSKRKHLSIIVKKDASVIVRAPLRLSKKRILEFVNSKMDWINEKVNEIN
jgi:predicted metal-dependent hydrolase